MLEFDSQDGWTALIWAAWNGHTECVRLLIDAGADKDAKDQVRVGQCFAGSSPRSVSSLPLHYVIVFVLFSILVLFSIYFTILWIFCFLISKWTMSSRLWLLSTISFTFFFFIYPLLTTTKYLPAISLSLFCLKCSHFTGDGVCSV